MFDDTPYKGPSRAEVETLLVLDAVGAGCPERELAGRLGLSRSLAGAIAVGLVQLVALGLLSRTEDGLIERTTEGERFLRSQLEALGIQRVGRSSV